MRTWLRASVFGSAGGASREEGSGGPHRSEWLGAIYWSRCCLAELGERKDAEKERNFGGGSSGLHRRNLIRDCSSDAIMHMYSASVASQARLTTSTFQYSETLYVRYRKNARGTFDVVVNHCRYASTSISIRMPGKASSETVKAVQIGRCFGVLDLSIVMRGSLVSAGGPTVYVRKA